MSDTQLKILEPICKAISMGPSSFLKLPARISQHTFCSHLPFLLKVQETKATAKDQMSHPRAVLSAVSVKVGDTVRYILEDGLVQILKFRQLTESAGLLLFINGKNVRVTE